MLITTSKISKEFTDAANTDMLLKSARKMINKGIKKDSVKLSLNLLDPDVYEFEYSERDNLMCITRHGTSLTEENDIIGATGLFGTDTLEELTKGIEDILGITRVELTGCDIYGDTRTFTVSKGWYMMQDEDEDILMKALADVNASLIWTEDSRYAEKILALKELQENIRNCKTQHPDLPLRALYVPADGEYILTIKGREIVNTDDKKTALEQADMFLKGYSLAKDEALSPEKIGQLIDVFEDFLEEKEIIIDSSVNEMVESGEYSKDEAENGIMGCRTCIYGSDYDRLATGLRKVAGI